MLLNWSWWSIWMVQGLLWAKSCRVSGKWPWHSVLSYFTVMMEDFRPVFYCCLCGTLSHHSAVIFISSAWRTSAQMNSFCLILDPHPTNTYFKKLKIGASIQSVNLHRLLHFWSWNICKFISKQCTINSWWEPSGGAAGLIQQWHPYYISRRH